MHWCIDPGSRIDFAHVQRHLLEHIGHMSALRLFSINHQDPDVVGNLAKFVRANPRINGLTSEDTWRLPESRLERDVRVARGASAGPSLTTRTSAH